MDGEEGAVKMAAAVEGEELVVVEAKAVGPDTSNPEQAGLATNVKVGKQTHIITPDRSEERRV